MLATIGSQIGQFIERKRAEEALRRSEAWLTQAQTLSHIGTWVMHGPTLRFLYWSDESYRIWGFDPGCRAFQAEMTCGDAFTQTIEKGCGKRSRRHCASTEISLSEFRILLPGGTVKYLEANAHHEFSPLGALLEVICTSVDVTERKRAQDEHEKLRQAGVRISPT